MARTTNILASLEPSFQRGDVVTYQSLSGATVKGIVVCKTADGIPCYAVMPMKTVPVVTTRSTTFRT